MSETLFLQAAPGLEAVVDAEARLLGRTLRVPGGVELRGPAGLHAEVNARLRVCERVLMRLFAAEARTWTEAVRALTDVRLDAVATREAPVVLEATLRIAGAPPPDRARAALAAVWKRPVEAPSDVERTDARPRLVLRALPGSVTLSGDTSGERLHKRGWRQEISRAPMRETLAAGVLRLAEFDPRRPLWDPMCGSGTLAIEAALASRHVAPALGRRFAAEDWPLATGVDWAGLRERLRAESRPRATSPIVGTDLHAGALGTARRNARRAGVLEDLRLERRDVAEAVSGDLPPGLLVANLPYGKRVGAAEDLPALDLALARTVRTGFPGWRVALLVDDVGRLERAFRRPPDAVEALSNGGLAVALALYEPIAASPGTEGTRRGHG